MLNYIVEPNIEKISCITAEWKGRPQSEHRDSCALNQQKTCWTNASATSNAVVPRIGIRITSLETRSVMVRRHVCPAAEVGNSRKSKVQCAPGSSGNLCGSEYPAGTD